MSPLGFTMTPALSTIEHRHVSEGRVCSQLTFEVEEVPFSPADCLALADDHGLQHLLPELGLTLLDGSQEHVADGARGEAVQSGTDASAGNHVQVLGSGVVSAVHHGRHGERVRNLQLDSVATSTTCPMRTN